MRKPVIPFLMMCSWLLVLSEASGFAQSVQSFQNITIALANVQQVYHTSTGFEMADADTTPIGLDLSGKDVHPVLDALVAQKRAYAWSLEDGVYDLYPRTQANSLAQLHVAGFVLTNATICEAQEALFNLPEVRNWLSQHHAVRNRAASGSVLQPGLGAPPLPEPARISLNLNSVGLRTILNQIIRKFDRMQWIISHVVRREYGKNVEYISIEP